MPAPDVTSRLMVFLFTDLVDSTGMKERLGDRNYVRLVLQPHNAIFRELLASFPGGQERDNWGISMNAELRTPNFELRTPNNELRTMNI